MRHLRGRVSIEGFVSTSAHGAYISDDQCPNVQIGIGIQEGKQIGNNHIGRLVDYMSGKKLSDVKVGERLKFTLEGSLDYRRGIPTLYVDNVSSYSYVDEHGIAVMELR
jgi:hypothetical protein